jgi:hypothetical protein
VHDYAESVSLEGDSVIPNPEPMQDFSILEFAEMLSRDDFQANRETHRDI